MLAGIGIAFVIVMGWDGGSRQNRKWLEDELTQALRTRAIVAAFFVLMAGGTLALGLALTLARARETTVEALFYLTD